MTETVERKNLVIAALVDFESHLNDWRWAIEIAKQSAIDNDDPEDDGSYWNHQLKVLNRVAKGFGFK